MQWPACGLKQGFLTGKPAKRTAGGLPFPVASAIRPFPGPFIQNQCNPTD